MTKAEIRLRENYKVPGLIDIWSAWIFYLNEENEVIDKDSVPSFLEDVHKMRITDENKEMILEMREKIRLLAEAQSRLLFNLQEIALIIKRGEEK